MMNKSPIQLSESAKAALEADENKKKAEFDKKLAQFMLDESMIVVPELKYTNRGIFAQLSFESMSDDVKDMLKKKLG